jgi:hypothetical protein
VNTRITVLACGAALTLCSSLVLADQVYKWTDPEGHVHFSQTPPPGATAAKPMNVYVPPPDPQSLQNTQAIEQAQTEKDKAAADAAAKAKPDPAKEAAKQQQCDDLRTRLQVLTQSGRAATTDAKGDLTFLDDDARAKQIKAIQDQLTADCKGH